MPTARCHPHDPPTAGKDRDDMSETESDPADYGYEGLPRGSYGVRIIPNRGPEDEVCRNCKRAATEHTPGRFSIYGVCPPVAAGDSGGGRG